MLKTVTVGEKELKFKSSAATNILYKKMFGIDILIEFSEYAKNSKELRMMKEKINELRKDESKKPEEILEAMNNLMNSDAYKLSAAFQSETLPRLAFIMYLEANESVETLFKKLTEEQYLFWLLGIDQDELLAVTGQVMDIWTSGTRNTSKEKNAVGR